MFLLIDMSEFDCIGLTFFGSVDVRKKEYVAKNRSLLVCIEEGVKEQDKTAHDIRGIAVVVGVGSFTSTRIAVTVANTFAYTERIPVLAVSEAESKDLAFLEERFRAVSPGAYISATYSADPHITAPRPRG